MSKNRRKSKILNVLGMPSPVRIQPNIPNRPKMVYVYIHIYTYNIYIYIYECGPFNVSVHRGPDTKLRSRFNNIEYWQNRYPISYIQYGNIPIRDSPPPPPPHAPPGPSADGPSMGWGGVGWGGVGGNPLWVYFHIGYRILDIYFVISRSCYKYRNIFWIFDMHRFLDMLSWFVLIFSVFHRFLRRP